MRGLRLGERTVGFYQYSSLFSNNLKKKAIHTSGSATTASVARNGTPRTYVVDILTFAMLRDQNCGDELRDGIYYSAVVGD